MPGEVKAGERLRRFHPHVTQAIERLRSAGQRSNRSPRGSLRELLMQIAYSQQSDTRNLVCFPLGWWTQAWETTAEEHVHLRATAFYSQCAL